MIYFYVFALVLVTAGVFILVRGSDDLKSYFAIFLFAIGIGSAVYYVKAELRSIDDFPIEYLLIGLLSLYFIATIWAFVNSSHLSVENRNFKKKIDDYESIQIPGLKGLAARYYNDAEYLRKENQRLRDEKPVEFEPMPGTPDDPEYHKYLEAEIAGLKEQIRLLTDKCAAKDKERNALWIANDALKKEIIEINHRSIHDLRFETWGSILQRHGADRYNLSDKDYASLHYPTLNPDAVYYAAATGKCYHSVPWCYTLDTAARVYKAPLREVENDYRPCSFCVCLPKS